MAELLLRTRTVVGMALLGVMALGGGIALASGGIMLPQANITLTIAPDAPSIEEIAKNAKEGTLTVVEGVAPQIVGDGIFTTAPNYTLIVAEDAPNIDEIAKKAEKGAFVIEGVTPKIIGGRTGQATLAK